MKTNFTDEGINNLFVAVMEQAYEDSNLTMPTVTFKPNDEKHNQKQLKKLSERAMLIADAKDYISNMKEWFGN